MKRVDKFTIRMFRPIRVNHTASQWIFFYDHLDGFIKI